MRESARAKRLSIKVFPRGKVEVVVPKRTRPAEVASFVEENREWIAKARESFAADHAPESFALPQTIRLPAVGRTVRVTYERQTNLKSVRYRYGNGLLTLRGRTRDEALCVKAIRRWLTSLAREEFEPRLGQLSARTGIGYTRLQVRAQRTCWGSRSSSGTISLNLCLLFLEPALLQDLSCVLSVPGHMNHSRRCWKLVGRFEPEYRRLDRELGEAWRDVPAWLGVC